MTTLTQARIDYGFHCVIQNILCNVRRAKEEVSGPYFQYEKYEDYTGATYVAGARIICELQLPLYDDHPDDDDLVYYTEGKTALSLPSMGLAQAHQFFGGSWETAVAGVTDEVADAIDVWNDGCYITEIQLLDNLGNVVDSLSDRKPWGLNPRFGDDVEELKSSMRELMSQSAEESAWDNFDSSRRLGAQATEIHTHVFIIENRARLVA